MTPGLRLRRDDVRIERDDLARPIVVDLIALHLRAAHANSPPGSVFALDLSGLRDPAVTVWTAWEGDALLGVAALKRLDDGHCELKSMRTHPDHVRRGVGALLLDHALTEARAAGYGRMSLETGNNEPYAAARALYARAGFVPCGRFATYDDEAFSLYFTRVI